MMSSFCLNILSLVSGDKEYDLLASSILCFGIKCKIQRSSLLKIPEKQNNFFITLRMKKGVPLQIFSNSFWVE